MLGFAGSKEVNVHTLAQKLLETTEDTLTRQYLCRSCHHKGPNQQLNATLWTFDKFVWKNQVNKMGSYKDQLVNPWLEASFTQKSEKKCPNCAQLIIKQLTYGKAPNFVSCLMYKLKIEVKNQVTIPGHTHLYCLCGIVYFAPTHFVAKIIDKSSKVWYNNGFEMGEDVKYIGNIVNMVSKDPLKHKRYAASLLVYAKL